MSVNRAARIAFEEFLEEISKESYDVRIIAPVLNVDGAFDGIPEPDLNSAMAWFEIVEPLLYEYLFKVPGAEIEGKAIIAAQGIVEASYSHLEASYFDSEGAEKAYAKYRRTGEIGDGVYKALLPKLLVGPQRDPITIEGEKFDDWLVMQAQGWSTPVILQKYAQDEHLWMIPRDEDDPQSSRVPALDSEKLVKAAQLWKESLQKLPHKPGRTGPGVSHGRSAFKITGGFSGRLSKAQEERQEKRRKLLEEREVDVRDPLSVCAVRTKKSFENRELSPDSAMTKIKIPRMAERSRSLGSAPKRALRQVDVKKRWEATAKDCGLLLDPRYSDEGILMGYSPPEEDFLFADTLFDRNVLSMPSREVAMGYSRNSLAKPDKRKKRNAPDRVIEKSLERRLRERTDGRGKPWSIEMKLNEMGAKYPLGFEPATYLLGPRTGNLYPVKFISYGDHLQEHLPECFKKKYGSLFNDETVMALLLRQPPYLREGYRKSFTYIPLDKRPVICFEDELVNVLQGQELMRMADLHRYLESPLPYKSR